MTLDLSVVLATKDRAELLEATLAGLERQVLPPGLVWEVVVVDNGSADHTAEVLARASERLPLVTLSEPAPGKNRALNRALDVVRGRLLVFTDDDIVPEPGWLAELLAAAGRWPAHGVFGGRITPLYPDGAVPDWLRQHPFVEAAYAQYAPAEAEGPTKKLPYGPNFAVRAEAMQGLRYAEDIGPSGGDYVAGSETEFLQRLTRRGVGIVYVPSAHVQHVVRPNQLEVDWLLGRSYRLGRCLVELGFVQTEPGPRLAGVPVGVWPRLAKEWIFWCRGRFGDSRRRFLGGLDYHFLRGCIRQHRIRHRRAAVHRG